MRTFHLRQMGVARPGVVERWAPTPAFWVCLALAALASTFKVNCLGMTVRFRPVLFFTLWLWLSSHALKRW